ncbi:MAG: molybdopterin dinucleotide binding domain-containing protein, partial [Desulfobacterales bacterium]|nr:molybdopterin dinucleotide binding domain-containing protein [Desulfobacterales bacterium]
HKVIEPRGETRSDLAVFAALADRLGIEGYNQHSDRQWLDSFVAATPNFPNPAEFRQKGVYRVELAEPRVAFKKQIEDPERHRFATPSGKIEIYSHKIAQMDNPKIPAIPQHINPWQELSREHLTEFPLQLVSPHAKTRVNSQFDNIAQLKEKADDRIWINPQDAGERGIVTDDRVLVYNACGRLRIRAKVTDRIMPGVVSLDAGAWFQPDAEGVDGGGSVNVLTKDEMSPAGAFPSNTCRVQVESLHEDE